MTVKPGHIYIAASTCIVKIRFVQDSQTKGTIVEEKTRCPDLPLVKGQSRLDVRTYSCSQRTVNDCWNKLPADCVHSIRIKMSNNIIYRYLVRAGSA